MNKEKQIAPFLRFPEFKNDGEWEEDLLGNITSYFKGFAFKSKDYVSTGRRIIRVSDMGYDYIKEEDKAIYIKEENAIQYKKWALKKDDLIITTVGSKPPVYASLVGRSIVVQLKDEGSLLNQNAVCLRAKKIINQTFLNIQLKRSIYVSFIESIIRGNANQGSITLDNLFKFNIFFPINPKEQQKLANCLSSLDIIITSETEKLDHLKDHKKGLLQQLFPANGETKPQFRFPEFENDGDWIESTLDICLDYLQPTPYLVSSTDYEDKYETPVLTAGKTFILGYTNEKKGIFNKNLPVIIFDDFTTATKFVDFPFKAKSSAMKILLAKGDNNIQFLFETIQNLNFEVSTHKRHWISVFSKIGILKPKTPKEQRKIADCFSSADDLIKAQKIKIKALKKHKKGLMQQLFPNINE